MRYNEILSETRDLRARIKKGRLLIDETRPKFGFKKLTKLIDAHGVEAVPVKLESDSVVLCAKCIPLEIQYSSNEHPSMLEYIYLKEFNDNVLFTRLSPHITGYLGIKKVTNSSKAVEEFKFKKLEDQKLVKRNALVILAEFVNGGCLDDYPEDLTLYQWKAIIFQITYTLFVLQQKYSFMHNDLHCGNILLSTAKIDEPVFKYNALGTSFFVKHSNITPKLWDFGFSNMYNKLYYPNKSIPSLRAKPLQVYDKYYDLHFFITSLLDFKNLPAEVNDWIHSIYPKEVVLEDSDSESESSSRSERSDSTERSARSNSTERSVSSERSVRSERSARTDSSASTATTNDSRYLTEYLWRWRLLENVGDKLGLPTPETLLKDSFFDVFKESQRGLEYIEFGLV